MLNLFLKISYSVTFVSTLFKTFHNESTLVNCSQRVFVYLLCKMICCLVINRFMTFKKRILCTGISLLLAIKIKTTLFCYKYDHHEIFLLSFADGGKLEKFCLQTVALVSLMLLFGG